MTVAVVTGGGSGIGRALALELASQQCDVYIVGRTDEKLQAVVNEGGGRIHAINADVSVGEGRRRIKEALSMRPVAYLVHNAAVVTPMKTLDHVTEGEWRECFAINVEGPLFLTQALLGCMQAGSRVLHVSSGIAHFTYPGMVPYSSSKAALHMLYQGWSQELAQRGIAVGSVQPGIVDTDMQSLLRECDDVHFPARQVFSDFKKNNQFICVDDVARSMAWMLLKMPASEFVEKDWHVEEVQKNSAGHLG